MAVNLAVSNIKANLCCSVFIIAYGYVLSKLLYKFLHPVVYDVLLGVGAVWFAFLLYFLLSLLLIDIIRLFDGWFHFLPDFIHNNYELTKRVTAITVVVIVGLIVFLGNLKNVIFKSEILK